MAGTIRHMSLLLVLLLVACTESHGGSRSDAGGGGTVDGGGAVDGGGGSDACGPIDPGWCTGGPCCSDRVRAEIDWPSCTGRCPAGYGFACTPDPAADCAPPWMVCELNADCVLAPNTCCGPCGEPSLSDFDAINEDFGADHRASVCPEPGPCPGCPVALNNDIGATCRDGLCAGYDVRTMALSACTADTDCRLRVAGCCECGGDTSPFALIAIRDDAEGAYAPLVCDDLACPECAPAYPTTVEAFCAADGHCDVRSTATP